jgi:hypothetical protein
MGLGALLLGTDQEKIEQHQEQQDRSDLKQKVLWATHCSGSSGGGLGHGGGREHMFHLSKLARANTARREFAAN